MRDSIQNPSFLIKNKDGRSQSWKVEGHYPVDDVIDYVVRFIKIDGFRFGYTEHWLPKDIDYIEIINL